ncbi:hypothetical protein GN956_G27026, partial [Arapaima gigas]
MTCMFLITVFFVYPCFTFTRYHLRNEVIRFEKNKEKFESLYDRDIEDLKKLVEELEKVAGALERVHFKTTVGSLTGGVVGAAGGITSIVGLILAPFTLGASLIVTGVGVGVAVAGGVTSAASNITNMANQSKDRKKLEKIINEYREKMEPIIMYLEDISISGQKLKTYKNSFSDFENMLRTTFRLGRGLGGIAELIRLIQVVNIGKVAAQAARAVRVAEAFTGVLSALFLLLDIYFIYKDAREIHYMRQGNTQS